MAMNVSEYWIISAPGDKTCQQTWDRLNQVSELFPHKVVIKRFQKEYLLLKWNCNAGMFFSFLGVVVK